MANTGSTARTPESNEQMQADNARLQSEIAELKAELARLSSTIGTIANRRYEDLRDRASGYAEDFARQGAALRDQAYERAGVMEQEVERSIRERPLAAVAIAAGVGYLVGLISRSR
ncbi:DUF883 family protein [Chthonobacter albigriseus]|uniref:DUF883 family protein n=1 Tax=Chthonobacter albigriseus TaxID=1683161 RepID=UPI0015EEC779|nr:DUF883 family protein [Chthonobacter albigriseus]